MEENKKEENQKKELVEEIFQEYIEQVSSLLCKIDFLKKENEELKAQRDMLLQSQIETNSKIQRMISRLTSNHEDRNEPKKES